MASNVVHLWPMIEPGPNNLDQIRSISTPMLKRMWDDPDRWGGYCDEIYAAMQERGEGSYVAV